MKELENANIKNKEITSEVANNKNMTIIKIIIILTRIYLIPKLLKNIMF